MSELFKPEIPTIDLLSKASNDSKGTITGLSFDKRLCGKFLLGAEVILVEDMGHICNVFKL